MTPNNGIKNSPIVPIVAQKVATAYFSSKVTFFKKHKKSPNVSKISQSGHTDCKNYHGEYCL